MPLPDAVLLAARHLDEEEGPCHEGHTLTAADMAAIRCVLRHISGEHHTQQPARITRIHRDDHGLHVTVELDTPLPEQPAARTEVSCTQATLTAAWQPPARRVGFASA